MALMARSVRAVSTVFPRVPGSSPDAPPIKSKTLGPNFYSCNHVTDVTDPIPARSWPGSSNKSVSRTTHPHIPWQRSGNRLRLYGVGRDKTRYAVSLGYLLVLSRK